MKPSFGENYFGSCTLMIHGRSVYAHSAIRLSVYDLIVLFNSALHLVVRRLSPWHMLTARCRIVKTVLTNIHVSNFPCA